METLGLSTAKVQEDGLLRRLFWPTIANQYDVDLLGRRGFWLALFVGVVSFIGLAIQGNWLLGLSIFVGFVLGAAGIRQRSVAASALVLAMYALGIVGTWFMAFLGYGHMGSPFISIVMLMLLCANLRATVLSQRWLALGQDSEFPEHEDVGILHIVVNKFPQWCWPKGKYVFYLVAAVHIALNVLGFVALGQKARVTQSQPQSRSLPVHVTVVPGS